MEEIRKQKEKIRAEVMQLVTMQQEKLIEEVNQLRVENEELRKMKNNYSKLKQIYHKNSSKEYSEASR